MRRPGNGSRSEINAESYRPFNCFCGCSWQPAMCATTKEQVSHDILSYLYENSEAQDTVEGIVQWWLLEQRIHGLTGYVQEALADLVASGLLLSFEGSDSRVHYRINNSKQREIVNAVQRKFGQT